MYGSELIASADECRFKKISGKTYRMNVFLMFNTVYSTILCEGSESIDIMGQGPQHLVS